jgi:hypothetical protein
MAKFGILLEESDDGPVVALNIRPSNPSTFQVITATLKIKTHKGDKCLEKL